MQKDPETFAIIGAAMEFQERGIPFKAEVALPIHYKKKLLACPYRADFVCFESVIVETKGCWNAQLNTAMETQLKEQYLKDNKCEYGVYLVGWFNCPQWDVLDSRTPPAETLEEARKRFDDQATALSTAGITIRAFVLNTALRS